MAHNKSGIMAENYVQTHTILYWALLIGIMMITSVFYFFMGSKSRTWESPTLVFDILVPAVAGASGFVGRFLFKSQLSSVTKGELLDRKLQQHFTASILRYATLEAAGLFALVIFLITGKMIYLGIIPFMILMFLSLRPTKDRISQELNLNEAEKKQL